MRVSGLMFHEIDIRPFVADRFHAHCSCGWATFGTKLECELRASTHDLDCEPVAPEPQPTAAE
jgi:hypothetical protein